MNYLVFDINNILYRNFHAISKEPDVDLIVSTCHHSALTSINYYYKKYKPDDIVIAFDSHSWRKEYTKDDFFYKKYKGQRRKNLTPREEATFKIFDSHVDNFYDFLKENSSFLVVKKQYLEADDIIAEFVDSHKTDSVTLLTSDKDYLQLLDCPHLNIIDPVKDNKRNLMDWDFDPKLFMFEKCFRGDVSDNIMSAYPRLTKTKIWKAYKDTFAFANLLSHEFDVEYMDDDRNMIVKHYKTSEVISENEYLMDLRKQPDVIKKRMKQAILEAIQSRGKYNYYDFVKYCTKYNFVKILENSSEYGKFLNAFSHLREDLPVESSVVAQQSA